MHAHLLPSILVICIFLSCLKPPSDGVTLDCEWQVSLREAILKGNEIHDDLYDTDAIDVAVDEAVD